MSGSKKANIIFLDVDGTLVAEDSKVPDSARRACIEARRNGHILCVATGRQYQVIGADILSIGFDGIISAGGARVDAEGKTIFNAAFNSAVLSRIIDYFESRGAGCTFERADCLVASERVFEQFRCLDPEYYKLVEELYIKNENVVEGALDPNFPDVAKVIFCGVPGLSFEEIRAEFAGECEVFKGSMPFYGKGNGELCPAGVNKGSAVDLLLRYFGKEKEDAVAIGDGENDLPMFRRCGIGIAMGNGDASLKKAADFITGSVSAGGLAQAFVRYGLI
ncbi:MAG: HAD family hydrolase [Spirochaetaceae bacterium]|jgi:Cof subfamily protein (haloacid dehalogenase superfamily)|nr:HAD family hydrolase [Spirochaetaceae bacterium]